MKKPNAIPAAKSRTKLRCLVCLGKGDGSKVNGIPCCSACRLFYFRNLKDGLLRLPCNKNETCSSLNPRLNPKYCRFCKLKKCLNVGMADGTASSKKPADDLSPDKKICFARSRKVECNTLPGSRTDLCKKQPPSANTMVKTSKTEDDKESTRTDSNEGNLHCISQLASCSSSFQSLPH